MSCFTLLSLAHLVFDAEEVFAGIGVEARPILDRLKRRYGDGEQDLLFLLNLLLPGAGDLGLEGVGGEMAWLMSSPGPAPA